jgi:hypothetical protein
VDPHFTPRRLRDGTWPELRRLGHCLRVSEQVESEGLDINLHAEAAYA